MSETKIKCPHPYPTGGAFAKFYHSVEFVRTIKDGDLFNAILYNYYQGDLPEAYEASLLRFSTDSEFYYYGDDSNILGRVIIIVQHDPETNSELFTFLRPGDLFVWVMDEKEKQTFLS